jgi:hypothetical protein
MLIRIAFAHSGCGLPDPVAEIVLQGVPRRNISRTLATQNMQIPFQNYIV